ncbi:MAG: tripartite tricarboxylate transporter TctB family protein [Desulfobacteraceae bacterium]|nr:MAG: tripartite tricarboxylate transporter TctB family protein [Desulfobacteraceae bacterium]
MTEHRSECEQLLALATPQIYRRNLFRVLGLPVNATSKDVHRQQKRRQMQEKLGVTPSDNRSGPLSLKPPPTEDEIRAAMERLNHPVDRLLDECLWFWPTNASAAADPAIKALESGEVKKASQIWSGQSKTKGPGEVASHNLAVLYHLAALDHEENLTQKSLDQKRQELLANIWRRAFTQWNTVLDGEEFWSVVRERIREMNDLQLTTGFARSIRASLPKALLLINVRIALNAAERGDTDRAKQHILLVSEVAFREGLAEEAVREGLQPIRNRIKTAIDSAKSGWTAMPQHGNRYVRELAEQIKGCLTVVDAILRPGNVSRSSLHDMAVEAMLEGETAFSIKTNDWKEGIDLLELARKNAASDTLRTKIDEDIETNRKNIENGNDWCSPGYWDLPEETTSQLESIREKTRAGDYDGAIRELLALNAQNGEEPMRRCLAFSLSLKGINLANDAQRNFNPETGVIGKILENLREMSEHQRMMTFINKPDPYSTFQPPCLCCQRSGYTNWVNFTYKNIQLFMCSSCSTQHNSQFNAEKTRLRKGIESALEYLLLAQEMDPHDPGVQRNLNALKGTAQELECPIPTTKNLKKKLGEVKGAIGKERDRKAKAPVEKGMQPAPKFANAGAILYGLGALFTALTIYLSYFKMQIPPDFIPALLLTKTGLLALGTVLLTYVPLKRRWFIAFLAALPTVILMGRLSLFSNRVHYVIASAATWWLILELARNWRKLGWEKIAKRGYLISYSYLALHGAAFALIFGSGKIITLLPNASELIMTINRGVWLATGMIWIWIALTMFAAGSSQRQVD